MKHFLSRGESQSCAVLSFSGSECNVELQNDYGVHLFYEQQLGFMIKVDAEKIIWHVKWRTVLRAAASDGWFILGFIFVNAGECQTKWR